MGYSMSDQHTEVFFLTLPFLISMKFGIRAVTHQKWMYGECWMYFLNISYIIAISEYKITVRFHSQMITNFVVTLVLLNMQSSPWAHFKTHEVSFKMTYHTTALAQNSSRPLKILFDHGF
jgi:hypothetical protein